jgi:hypothetical protein
MLVPVMFAFASWLYVQTLTQCLGPAPIGIKEIVPLDILVLDDAMGQPIQGAKVDIPFLHPAWRNGPDLRDRDLRKAADPFDEMESLPFRTDEGGKTRVGMIVGRDRRIRDTSFGLMPEIEEKVVFSPLLGARVSADGYETWVRYLDDIAREDGRPLKHLIPFSIVVRLKQATSSSSTTSPTRRVQLREMGHRGSGERNERSHHGDQTHPAPAAGLRIPG